MEVCDTALFWITSTRLPSLTHDGPTDPQIARSKLQFHSLRDALVMGAAISLRLSSGAPSFPSPRIPSRPSVSMRSLQSSQLSMHPISKSLPSACARGFQTIQTQPAVRWTTPSCSVLTEQSSARQVGLRSHSRCVPL